MRRFGRGSSSEEFNIWPAFTDVVTGIFLFLIFVFSILIIQLFLYSNRLAELEEFLGTFEKEMKELEKEFGKKEGGEISIDVKQGRIILEAEVYFDHNKSYIKNRELEKELRGLGRSLVAILAGREDLLAITIDGHTDNTGSRKHNLGLGSERAVTVFNLLTGLLFSMGSEFDEYLNNSTVSNELKREFEKNEFVLSKNARITIQYKGQKWLIEDQDKRYEIERAEERESEQNRYGEPEGKRYRLYVYAKNDPEVIDPEKYDISANTYGEYKPIIEHPEDKIEVKNRRIEIRIMPKFERLLKHALQ